MKLDWFTERDTLPLCNWDTGPDKTPYCCTFHWFRLPDEQIVGLDVIRSDDIGVLSLRAYVVEPSGDIRGLSYKAPQEQWAPFATDQRPLLDGPKPCLGRGSDWIAGSLRAQGQAIQSVRFNLQVVPESRPHNIASLWDLQLVEFSAVDFTHVHTTGWLEIDGTRYDIDSHGPVSLHLGARLLAYGYCATVPHPSHPKAPSLLLGSVTGADVRAFGKCLENEGFTYAYGDHGIPPRMYRIGVFERNKIPLPPFGHIDLHDIRPFPHEMLGIGAVTAAAQAVLYRPLCDPLSLGRVILDYRGPLYTGTLDWD